MLYKLKIAECLHRKSFTVEMCPVVYLPLLTGIYKCLLCVEKREQF